LATAGVPLWSTTAANNSTADPAVNWAEGQAPSSVNDSARAMMASVAKWRDDLYGLTTGGTSTAYTVTSNATYASTSAMSGAIFTIVPHTTSGAAPTLAVDSLTAYAINQSTGVAIPTGALVSGTPYLIKYVHASTEFIVLGVVGKNTLAALDIITGTSETAIATGDTLAIYDVSATANRRMLVSDFLKVVNALSADASPDRAADYVMTYDASAMAAKKVLLQDLPAKLPRGYIDGCTLSNGTDATNDINIAAGVCRDSTNTVDITVAAMSGKQLDANWAPGASAGMRNSAVGIANGTYHIYAVAKADGTQDIYAHTSATVATVITALQAESGGTDYVYARRIGSILRESAAIVGFVQFGDRFDRKDTTVDTTTNPGTSAVTITLEVPTGILVEAITRLSGTQGGTGGTPYIMLSALDATDETPGSTNADLHIPVSGGADGGRVHVRTNTSGQIRLRSSYSDGATVVSNRTVGWNDLRGKDS
jgi:hypothetical protein